MDKMMTILNEEHENVMINLNRRIDLTNILQQYYETFNEQHMNKRDNEAK